MTRTVAIGEQDFNKIIENHYFYIDKTNFIKEWWENGDAVTLITRPRRFGKTLTLNMTEYFFSVNHAESKNLFESLYIWREEKYRQMQGTYPVISFSFANIKADNYEEAYYGIRRLFAREYRRNAFLMESGYLLQADKDLFHKIMDGIANVSDICSSLNQLSEYLYDYYKKKVIILLDEYDTPMQEAYVNGYWEELTEFMRKFMNATFKTNPYLERGIMTGITRVGKESVFSDLNNLAVITTTSKDYGTMFGFTEQEVFQALDEYGLQNRAEDIKRWYDGFRFGDHNHIYNPWSILMFLKEKEIAPYWANTSSNRLIGKLIQEGSTQIKTVMEHLMNGIPFDTVIDEQVIFNQLDEKEDAIWSLLLASGYLKVENYFVNERGQKECILNIVNLEVRRMFEDLFSNWFAGCRASYNDFIHALLQNDLKSMNVYMNRIALSTVSFFDSGNKPSEISEPERFYHGFVLGLLVDLNDQYIVSSNRESGIGRCDVLMEPRNRGDDGIIFEFKVFDTENGEKDLKDTATVALSQILARKYTAVLETKCDRHQIRIYGFAFKGKEVLIEGGYVDRISNERGLLANE